MSSSDITEAQAYSVSPLEGRYKNILGDELKCFSEFNLMKMRVQVECEYYLFMLHLVKPGKMNCAIYESIHGIVDNFSFEEYKKIKQIEKETNHDVKAVEYYLRTFDCFEFKSMIHYGLTSEDINSVSYAMIIHNFFSENIYDTLSSLCEDIDKLARKCLYKTLSFTHGQPATPKLMSDRLAVFIFRLNELLEIEHKFSCKFGGSVGTLESHKLVYPEVDWDKQIQNFLEVFHPSLERQQYTTQIDNYDMMVRVFQTMMGFNAVMKDLCQDMWLLISKNYFKLVAKEGEVGSSAMPHKVNPIDFENAEGQLRIADALFGVLAGSMPVSFLERDLSGSTMMRNVGVAFAHTVLAIKGIRRGLGKLEINLEVIQQDLTNNPQVLSEIVQNFMRSRDIDDSYEKVKEFTRGKVVTLQVFIEFIDSLEELSDEDKVKLKEICNRYLVA